MVSYPTWNLRHPDLRWVTSIIVRFDPSAPANDLVFVGSPGHKQLMHGAPARSISQMDCLTVSADWREIDGEGDDVLTSTLRVVDHHTPYPGTEDPVLILGSDEYYDVSIWGVRPDGIMRHSLLRSFRGSQYL